MIRPLKLHPDRLLPADPDMRNIARRLYAEVACLPVISPHGHTDPEWWATNAPFGNAAELLLHPDHYVFRMLYSQGVSLEALGIGNPHADPRESWRLFAERYALFRGTPSRMWLDWVFAEGFGIDVLLSDETSDHYYDAITQKLATDAFRPRALFERYNIEVIATTESPLNDLRHHQTIRESGWKGRVITAYRPDPVVDPIYESQFRDRNRLLNKTYRPAHDLDDAWEKCQEEIREREMEEESGHKSRVGKKGNSQSTLEGTNLFKNAEKAMNSEKSVNC